MLERLRGLPLPDTSYVPDADEPSQDLIAAAYVRGATLFTAWLLSGYGDDIQPTHRELEGLLARLNSVRLDATDPLDRTRSLSRRIDAELAFQRGDYAAALTGIAKSILPLYADEIDDTPPDLNDAQFAPWLSDAEIGAAECIEAIEHKDDVDWPVVVQACELLSRCFFDVSEYVGLRTFDEDLNTQHAFWNERSGWARAKLTPDRLRNLLKQQDDESAAQRVETYFFADGRWERLPERAQRALVTADRMLISSSRGRYALVANEIRIATEEMLYYYLWLPLSEWIGAQRQPPPGWRTILGRPKEGRRSPSIDDYVSLLWHSPIKDYFQTLGMSDDDVQFLTKENRTTKHLQALQRTRNAAEHEPGDTVDPRTVRQLYAESLGIGRKGVLPELVRLLAKD